jgi:ribonucleoside-diphosphate reductase alpha chain
MKLRYSWKESNGVQESWNKIARRVTDNVLSAVSLPKDTKDAIYNAIQTRKFIPGGRFLAQSGREYHQTNNCFLLKAEDTREGWGELMNKTTTALMSGGGIGVVYSDIRPTGTPLKRTGGTSSGVLPLCRVINEIGRGVMSGGSRRSAIWAGLHWYHSDIEQFITAKNWSQEVRKLKEKDYDFPATLDMTNISVILDKEFFSAYDDSNHPKHQLAYDVYWKVIERMLKTGEPGFSVDYNNKEESLRNACTEIVSDTDSDVCCLGSPNLSRITSLGELKEVTELGQIFLLAGTEYSDVPYPKVKEIREKYRRTGLGLMGIHEWLIVHGYRYEPNDELANWLQTWKDTSDSTANEYANHFSFNQPIAKRAIAPNGSISIAGGTTTSGIEPIFSLAYQRRYLTPTGWKKQYVVDFVAKKLHDAGISLDNVEDAYTLSHDVERRIKFQAFVQSFVDNAISSTINLPEYGTDGNNNNEKFGKILMTYLPQLRGITAYPDGARHGQPLTHVDFDYAIGKEGVEYEGNEDCPEGVCGL